MFNANGTVRLPYLHKDSLYKIGTRIIVSRNCIFESIRDPNLPEWFEAEVCLVPLEPGNAYRWYDPFIWFRADIPLTIGNTWPTADKRMCYVGKLWHPCLHLEGTKEWNSHCNEMCRSKDYWAKPI